jgi:hypothetical protein
LRYQNYVWEILLQTKVGVETSWIKTIWLLFNRAPGKSSLFKVYIFLLKETQISFGGLEKNLLETQFVGQGKAAVGE